MKKNLLIVAVVVLLSLSGRAHGYNLYFGDLHSHTSFSDGQGLPENAYDMARNDAHLDYWTVSDHVEQLLGNKADPVSGSETNWDRIKNAAKAKTEDNKFVAISAFEWATDYVQGHINVINTDEIPGFNKLYPLKSFYKWIYNHPGALFGFNHPSSNAKYGCLIFDHFKLVKPVAKQAFYVAVNSREDLEFYYLALDNGWWVGPSAQQDNHSRDWGIDGSGNLTAIYADAITEAGILDAFRNRRFYATNDRSLRLWFSINDMPMGTKINASTLVLDIKVNSDDGREISSVKLISNQGVQVNEWMPGSASFETKLEMPVDFDSPRWFLVLAETVDEKFSVSAPIQVVND